MVPPGLCEVDVGDVAHPVGEAVRAEGLAAHDPGEGRVVAAPALDVLFQGVVDGGVGLLLDELEFVGVLQIGVALEHGVVDDLAVELFDPDVVGDPVGAVVVVGAGGEECKIFAAEVQFGNVGQDLRLFFGLFGDLGVRGRHGFGGRRGGFLVGVGLALGAGGQKNGGHREQRRQQDRKDALRHIVSSRWPGFALARHFDGLIIQGSGGKVNRNWQIRQKNFAAIRFASLDRPSRSGYNDTIFLL